MLRIYLCTLIFGVASASVFSSAAADSKDVIVSVPAAPVSDLTPPLPDAPREFRTITDEDALHEGDSHMLHEDHSATESVNTTLHDEINALLGPDEERVLSKGEVHTRKKRFFCRRCYPTVSYGYGGGGGCCGACGGCGRSRPRVQVVVQPVAVPVYGGRGRGGGCCGGCNVCGRK